MRRLLFGLALVLASASVTTAQTFTAVLTDAGAKGKVQVLGNATFTLDAANDVLHFTIIFRSDLFANQQISVNVGSPARPGPAIFVLAAGQALSPIEGAVHRGAEIAQPEHRINDWDDAIDAMFQNKTFVLMESPSYPSGVSGRVKRY
jgi:hypothetical protein